VVWSFFISNSAVIINCKSPFICWQVANKQLINLPADKRILFMTKDITPPKWIKGFKEVPFSKLSQTDEDGNVIEFDPSEEGVFEKDLYTSLEVEIITCDLGKKEKEAFELKSGGLSRKEIAEEMNIKENAVKSLLYRAGKKIKKKTKGKFNQGRKIDYKKLLKEKIKNDPSYRKFRKKIND